MLKGRMAKTIDYQGASDAQLWSMTFPAQMICSASHQQCYLLTVKIIVFSLLRLSASIMVFVYRCFYCPWTFNSLFVPSVLLTTCQTNVMMFTHRALERTVVKCYSLWQLLGVLLWKYISVMSMQAVCTETTERGICTTVQLSDSGNQTETQENSVLLCIMIFFF